MTKMKHLMSTLMVSVCILSLISLIISSATAQTFGVSQNGVYSEASSYGYQAEAGQKWAVTDGLAVFSFFVTIEGDIVYQTGYDFPPGPYNAPITTFLNHTQVNSIDYPTGFFTLTQGVVTTIAPSATPVFVFTAIWASGRNRISAVQLVDPMTTGSGGLRYFLPFTVTNNTYNIGSTQTDGSLMALTGINVPNGDALIGDGETVSGTNQATIYQFSACNSGASGCIVSLNKVYDWTSPASWFTAQAEYVGGYAYYVVGVNHYAQNDPGNPAVTIYQASPSAYYIPNATAEVGTAVPCNKFTIATDLNNLYVAGEDDTFFWVQTIANGTLGPLLIIDQEDLGVETIYVRGIFLSTHSGGTGVHFYFDYQATNVYLGVAYSHDNGYTWAMSSQIQNLSLMLSGSNIHLTGAARTPSSYNPEVDYLLATCHSNPPGGNIYTVDIVVVSLPANLNVITGSAITIVNVNTVVVTQEVNTPVEVAADLITPMIMLVVVAIPAGVFGMIGRGFGGGRAGLTLMFIGVGIGLMAGILYGIYPVWALLIVILALVAAFWNRSQGGASPEVPPQ